MKNNLRFTTILFATTFVALVLSFSGCSFFDSRTEQQVDEGTQATVSEEGQQEKQEAADTEPAVKEVPLDAHKEAEPESKRQATEEAKSEVSVESSPPAVTKLDEKLSESEQSKAVLDEERVTKKQEPQVQPEATTKSIPKSTGANHFIITVGDKDPTHPFYGKGHSLGFSVNGVGGDDIVVERGKTYLIEVVTDPLHDVYLSEKDIGWGSMAWNQGVEGQFIYKGIITFKPDKDTPDELYYSCRNHPYMGGKVHVLNPGQKATLTKRNVPGKTTSKVAQPTMNATKGMVEQKLMYAKMLMGSNATKSVTAGKNKEADDLYMNAENAIASAKQKLDAGKYNDAYTLAVDAVEDLKKAKKLTPSESQLEQFKETYKELQGSLADFEQSHDKSYKQTLKKKGKDAAVDYDKDKVKKLKTEADAAVKKNDYATAIKLLEQAQRSITVALKQMLDSTTIVYDLNFETPQEEYEYELRRFKGYEILIPIAIKAKNPTEGAKGLMKTYLEKGRKMREAAIAKAAAGDYPVAIAMLLDATNEVRRALRMIGVSQ